MHKEGPRVLPGSCATVLRRGLFTLLILIGSGLLVAGGEAQPERPLSGATIQSRDVTFRGADFDGGQSKGPMSKDAGLSLTMPSTAVYTSPIVLASLPFSDLGAAWAADLPPGTSLILEIRSSPDEEGDQWTDWELIEEEDDLPAMPFGQYAGELYFVPQRDGVHRRFQYRLHFAAVQAHTLPRLDQLTFTLIDAREGPSTSEMMALQGPKGELSGVDRPPVISREAWGCPEGGSSPRWPPEYERVTHVVIHHTATPNDDTDWAARMRSIWYYHANTRGWGDIGYNFLIDPLGNVYEGRAGGGDQYTLDVVGGHARNYNYGTMGVGNLGTYSSAPVPAPLQETLEALIAWKASQRGIDPLGRSFNSYKVYDHIAGHRDLGDTSCPGEILYGLLPTIRQNVQVRLLQQEEAIAIDELDPEFTRSEAYWHDGCGRADHAWWTHTTTDPALSMNWATWRPDLPLEGWYEVFAYVPNCPGEELPEYTEHARYRVYYRDGGSTVVVNQREERGRWVSLGTYPFYVGTTGYVYLGDIASDHWRSLWYDTVRWVLREPSTEPPPPPAPHMPTDGAWLTSRQVQLSWTIPTTVTVDDVQLVVATDRDLVDRLVDAEVGPVSSHELSLSSDYPLLYWSVRAHNGNGYGPFAPIQQFGVDTSPPHSSATALLRAVTGVHILLWEGQDDGSGVAAYTVQTRDGTSGPWQDLWVDVPWTSGIVEVPGQGKRYFRVHAVDNLGNVEPAHPGEGDLSSDEVVRLTWSWYYPLVLSQALIIPPTSPPLPTETPWATPVPSATPTPPGEVTVLPSPAPPSPTPMPPATPTVLASPTGTAPPPGLATRLPSPSPAGTSAAALPDLQIVALSSSQNSPFDCDRPSGITVQVSNKGIGPAGAFSLVLTGRGVEGCRWQLEGLEPGRQIERICPVVVLNTTITATVDLGAQVVESDEGNNVLVSPINVLVLPTCTPRPTK